MFSDMEWGNNLYADMHIHTYFSDGTLAPEEVAEVAKNRGISIISVCDHNSIEAYDRLRPACDSLELTLIQGVELDVCWEKTTLHVLAYNFDPQDKGIRELIARNKAEYDLEGLVLIENMEKEYPSISTKDYEAYEKPLYRGGWKSINYLYDRGLSKNLLADGFKYIKQYGKGLKFGSMEEASKIIRSAGGVPILAHPGLYWDENEIHEVLPKLLTMGIGGLECFYPVHNKVFTKKCVDLCKASNLCITVGCDGHGEFAKESRGVVCDIGVLKIDISMLNLHGIKNLLS